MSMVRKQFWNIYPDLHSLKDCKWENEDGHNLLMNFQLLMLIKIIILINVKKDLIMNEARVNVISLFVPKCACVNIMRIKIKNNMIIKLI